MGFHFGYGSCGTVVDGRSIGGMGRSHVEWSQDGKREGKARKGEGARKLSGLPRRGREAVEGKVWAQVEDGVGD